MWPRGLSWPPWPRSLYLYSHLLLGLREPGAKWGGVGGSDEQGASRVPLAWLQAWRAWGPCPVSCPHALSAQRPHSDLFFGKRHPMDAPC